MKVALYARVSSDRQDIDLSISAQMKALSEYAQRNGYYVVREFVDEAESGRSIDRPGFRQMIAAARQNPPPFEAVLVWKLSRFARNREDSIIYKSLLRRRGIQVISMNEPVEDTPAGRLFEGIIEVVDEFYSANLSQDVVRGMGENAARGFRNGGRPPYGYVRVKVEDGVQTRTKLEPDVKTAPIVQRIFRECLEGKGLKAIARSLNADGIPSARGTRWGMNSVENVLHNEAYAGVMVWPKRSKRSTPLAYRPALQRVERAWPAIVHKTVFDRAKAMLAARAPAIMHPRQVDSTYVLSGLMRCGICGATMVGHGARRRYSYYMCGNARRKGREACSMPILSKKRIERLVIDRIRSHVLTDDNLRELVRLTNEELAHTSDEQRERLALLDDQIAGIDGRLGRLYDALETGDLQHAELAPRIRELTAKKEELSQAKMEVKETLRHDTVDLVDDQVVRDYAEDLRSLLAESSIAEQRGFLRSFVDRIEVHHTEVKMHYTIPVPPNSTSEETVGVIPIVPHGKGSGDGACTCKRSWVTCPRTLASP